MLTRMHCLEWEDLWGLFHWQNTSFSSVSCPPGQIPWMHYEEVLRAMHSGSCLCRWVLQPLHEASFLIPIRMILIRSQLTSSITTATEKESYGQTGPESCISFMHWSGNPRLLDLEHSRWFLGLNLLSIQVCHLKQHSSLPLMVCWC